MVCAGLVYKANALSVSASLLGAQRSSKPTAAASSEIRYTIVTPLHFNNTSLNYKAIDRSTVVLQLIVIFADYDSPT